jgi:phosphatidylserine/phosphatidylglycerophosphate/cardiolipin synthase-like enzyme
MDKDIVVPAKRDEGRCTITPRWFVNGSEYRPHSGSFQLLINGENAYRAVHQAIANAQKSVCIICWGFQPSMFFIRDGKSPSIGDLLAQKAEQGVTVRVLCWAIKVDPTVATPGIGDIHILPSRPVNITGAQPLNESTTPGRWELRLLDKPPTSTDLQNDYDRWWYQHYDDDQEIEFEVLKKLRARFGDKKSQNLHFFGRGFSEEDRDKILYQKYEDTGLPESTKAVMAASPSHHQKMVLVDYEDPALAIGFVMGHNMLDEYWDTSEHSAKRRVLLKTGHPDPHPNTGPNGLNPRHDFSTQLTGPILGDLFLNFATAWKKETHQALHKPDFRGYYPRRADQSRYITGQILRTQSQYDKQHIKECYLQAVNNASRFIHIENQYFRWPPLAEKIKACAAGQNQCGRKPETHGPLYLFVITNSTDTGVGAGTVTTYRMLESLGRADAIPGVARDQKMKDINAEIKRLKYADEKAALDEKARLVQGAPGAAGGITGEYEDLNAKIKAGEPRVRQLEQQKAEMQRAGASYDKQESDLDGQISAADKEIQRAEAAKSAYDQEAAMLAGVPGASQSVTDRYAKLNRDIEAAKARKRALEQEKSALQNNQKVILPEERPGLKFHICTLVAPDTAKDENWIEVYIHAKLMTIDDTFMTVGSANINTRSMQVDSELNIAHCKEDITCAARRTLWEHHTNGRGAQDNPGEAFDAWEDIMEKNKARRDRETPRAPLAAFLRASASRSNLD